MFTLSWQITALSLVLLPVFILPARRVGRRLAEITRESYELDAKMNATMTERFGVAGALLVKLFGRPDAEAGPVRRPGRPGPRHRRAVRRCTRATFFVAMTAGRRRWPRRSTTAWAAGSRVTGRARAPAPWSPWPCC